MIKVHKHTDFIDDSGWIYALDVFGTNRYDEDCFPVTITLQSKVDIGHAVYPPENDWSEWVSFYLPCINERTLDNINNEDHTDVNANSNVIIDALNRLDRELVNSQDVLLLYHSDDVEQVFLFVVFYLLKYKYYAESQIVLDIVSSKLRLTEKAPELSWWFKQNYPDSVKPTFVYKDIVGVCSSLHASSVSIQGKKLVLLNSNRGNKESFGIPYVPASDSCVLDCCERRTCKKSLLHFFKQLAEFGDATAVICHNVFGLGSCYIVAFAFVVVKLSKVSSRFELRQLLDNLLTKYRDETINLMSGEKTWLYDWIDFCIQNDSK